MFILFILSLVGYSKHKKNVNEIIILKSSQVPLEPVVKGLDVEVISNMGQSIVNLYFKKGTIVEWHKHKATQISHVFEGKMKAYYKYTKDGKVSSTILEKGDTLFIPSNVYHKFVILEDTEETDFYNMERNNWVKLAKKVVIPYKK